MTRASFQSQLVLWLRQGVSPQRLAFTLVLGCCFGCIPMVGISTVLCALVALKLRLNQPAIQAANYAMLPLQIVLVLPFVRLGGWMMASSSHAPAQTAQLLAHFSPLHLAGGVAHLATQALLAWFVVALPTVLLLTPVLAHMLRHIPALAQSAE